MGASADNAPQQSTPTFDILSPSSPARLTTSTGHACRLLKRNASSRNSSRAQAQILRVHQGMRTGLTQCCLPQSAEHGDEDYSSPQASFAAAAAADWRAQQWNAQLGLQSSMM